MPEKYLVVWWMDKTPHYAEFGNRIAAEAAAHVRNGLMVKVRGTVEEVLDWYRRDEGGHPMPAVERDLLQ